jgi:methylmalonyl-CoA mutase
MTDPETVSFAADFPPATREQWRKLVDGVLKGAPFDRLIATTYDRLAIEPLAARRSDATPVAGRSGATPWHVLVRIDHPDSARANEIALRELGNGATGLSLIFSGSPGDHGFALQPSEEAIARALESVRFDAGIVLDIDLTPFARDVPQQIAALVKRGADPAAVTICFGYDPLTAIALTGKMPAPWDKTAALMAGLIRTLADGGFKGPFAVGDGRTVHNAGGSEAQELAYVLACAVAYLRALEASGMTLEAARDAVYFRLSADADQFLTMAKFRAARKLWARVEAACGLSPKPVLIAAETAWRMMAQRDPNVNILRATIAVFAAALGGADAITVLPFTAASGLPDRFARRIARNTQLVLGEESHLAEVADPAAGSGAIEDLTDALCQSAWALFRDIEVAGGAAAALQSGLIQGKVAAVREQRGAAIACRRDALTGVSIFPNLRDAEATVDAHFPPVKPAAAAPAAVTPLVPMRLAAPLEALRNASDRLLATDGARPKVFLVTLGTQAEFGPRASFAKNFFEAGGIEAVSGVGADRAVLAEAYKAAGTSLACLCSTDKIYEKEAAAVAAALKAAGAKHLYLAGRPGERESALQAAGVQSFVYEGCDALATLTGAYDILGIEIG